eukprot:GSChrysophyteH2.ASY1.ANO1.1634.1 assembled CDS
MSGNNKPSVSVGRSVGLCLCSIGKFSSKLLTEPFALAAAVLTSPDYTVLRGSIFVYGAYRLLRSEREKKEGRWALGSDSAIKARKGYTGDLDASASPEESARRGSISESAETPSTVDIAVNKGLGPPPSTSPITRLRSTDFNFPELSDNDSNVLVIGVAGGSGSGKTTYSRAIYRNFGEDNMSYLMHDCYYKDLSHLPKEERAKVNFDHPDSLDTELMIEHIKQLKKKQPVDIPTYDFSNHVRGKKVNRQEAKTLILVEGILIFNDPTLYNLLDIKIFLRTDDDIRLIRRMKRDIEERGRSVQGVVDQYLRTVRPMHVKYVEPSMKNADIIVPEGMNNVALDLVVHRLNAYVAEKSNDLHLRMTGAAARDVGAVEEETPVKA